MKLTAWTLSLALFVVLVILNGQASPTPQAASAVLGVPRGGGSKGNNKIDPTKRGFFTLFKAYWISLADPKFEAKLKPKEVEGGGAAPKRRSSSRKPKSMSISDLPN
eukprot:CAMPEP_0194673852 /NCGR_PEP_ID=MMETSP0295-20121207/7297_1 /TAXON_ID=39354 /ORGANISM="Heterosigma akashiwo, Strain CCMP2393" /LENGTH=106 /DNA_ID=CAMNT_0039557851 /DNA_START=30 /DNA_END=350 /DNA_ORIENTATION=-